MYDKILVALDGSVYSDYALDASLEFSVKQEKVELIGCHVYASELHRIRFMEMEDGLPERYQAEEKLNYLRNTHVDLIDDGMQLISDAYLAPMVKKAEKTNVRVSGITPEGKHYVKFIETANKHKPNLILLGAWGHGKNDEVSLGSFSQRIISLITGSDILLLKKALNFKSKPIVVCIDGSNNSYIALDKALKIAEMFDATVHLVAVYDPFFHLTVFKKIAEVLPEEDQKRFNFPAQEQLHDEIIDKGLEKIYEDYLERGRLYALTKGIKVETKLLNGKMVPKIHQYSSLNNASIVVLGRWGSHKESMSSIGSNALNLVHKTYENILIASSEDDEKIIIPELSTKEAQDLEWTPDAIAKLERVPGFVRKMVKKTVEDKAREKGINVVTVDLINKVSPKRKK
jgi:nucleotide-binding universal stress UspA family protein